METFQIHQTSITTSGPQFSMTPQLVSTLSTGKIQPHL